MRTLPHDSRKVAGTAARPTVSRADFFEVQR
jgi:hypothetical protein